MLAMYKVIIHILFLSVVSIAIELKSKFPNVGYLGTGYDIVSANTLNGTESTLSPGVGHDIGHDNDPGWKIPIIKLNASTSTSSDNAYNIPNNTQIIFIGNNKTCSLYNIHSNTITGDDSYSLLLLTDIKINGNYDNFKDVSFTDSTTYQLFQDLIYSATSNNSNLSIIVSVSGFCNTYYATFTDMQLTDNFANDIYQLSTGNNINNISNYHKFIDKYGQYYASGVHFGSKYTQSLAFHSPQWRQMIYKNYNITNLSLLTYQYTINIHLTSDEKQAVKEYKQYSYKEMNSLLGVSPDICHGENHEWLSHTQKQPFPITYNLSNIINLFTTKYITNVNNSIVLTLQNNMNKALNTYCVNHRNCSTHLKDVPQQNNYIQNSNANITQTNWDQVTVVCVNPNMVPISCHLAANLKGTGTGNEWSAFPISSARNGIYDGCKGGLKGQGEVQALCINGTNLKKIYKVKQTPITKSNVNVGVDLKCDSGWWRTGCGLQNSEETGNLYPNFASVYPSDRRTTCHCDSNVDSTCFAMCIDNTDGYIYDIYVNSTEGTQGTYDRECTKDDFYVFGCGFRSFSNDTYVKFLAGANDQSCKGYETNHTLYAICGRFNS